MVNQPNTSRKSSFVSPRKQRDVKAANMQAAGEPSSNQQTPKEEVEDKDKEKDKGKNDGVAGEDVVSNTINAVDNEEVTEENGSCDEIAPPLVKETPLTDTQAKIEEIMKANKNVKENEGMKQGEENNNKKNKITASTRKMPKRPPPIYPPPYEIFRITKLFWKIKMTLDIHIFLHESQDKVVEILALDASSDTADPESHTFSRSYLDYKLAYRLMKRVLQDEEEKKQIEELTGSMKTSPAISIDNSAKNNRLSKLDSLKMQNEIEVAKAMREKKRKQRGSLEEELLNSNEEYREKMMKSLGEHIIQRLKIIEIIPKHTESNATAKKDGSGEGKAKGNEKPEEGADSLPLSEEQVQAVTTTTNPSTSSSSSPVTLPIVQRLEYVTRESELELLDDYVTRRDVEAEEEEDGDADKFLIAFPVIP